MTISVLDNNFEPEKIRAMPQDEMFWVFDIFIQNFQKYLIYNFKYNINIIKMVVLEVSCLQFFFCEPLWMYSITSTIGCYRDNGSLKRIVQNGGLEILVVSIFFLQPTDMLSIYATRVRFSSKFVYHGNDGSLKRVVKNGGFEMFVVLLFFNRHVINVYPTTRVRFSSKFVYICADGSLRRVVKKKSRLKFLCF